MWPVAVMVELTGSQWLICRVSGSIHTVPDPWPQNGIILKQQKHKVIWNYTPKGFGQPCWDSRLNWKGPFRRPYLLPDFKLQWEQVLWVEYTPKNSPEKVSQWSDIGLCLSGEAWCVGEDYFTWQLCAYMHMCTCAQIFLNENKPGEKCCCLDVCFGLSLHLQCTCCTSLGKIWSLFPAAN